MISTTTDRVTHSSSDEANRQIRQQTDANIRRYATAGKGAINRRLGELEREWDVERLLEANASALVVLGSLLGATVNKRFFALPAIVGTFLFQHAIQGWCPPLPVIRRLGFRTATEIDEERYALKLLRGDFKDVADPAQTSGKGRANRLARAVRK